MFLPFASSPHPAAPLCFGAAIIYVGVWMAIQPERARRALHGTVAAVRRIEQTFQGASWWDAGRGEEEPNSPALSGIRVAGLVVAASGVVLLAGGLLQLG